MSIGNRKRRDVLKKYDGHCAYCGKVIEYKDMYGKKFKFKDDQ